MVSIVIMAGGSGTRFWPKSRKNIPKQCIPIASDKPMIVETVDRLKNLTDIRNMYISTGEHLKEPISKTLLDINFIIEPMAKNTAACIGLSAQYLYSKNPEDIMVIETADHTYNDVDSYINHLKKAIDIAKKDNIVLIGIKPTFPNTGFGYIKQGKQYEDADIKSFLIEEFKEKPDLKTAKDFFKSGDFLWNSGIFVCKVKVMLESMKKHMPQLYLALQKISDSSFDDKVLREEFEKLESISIDYGVMEKANNTVVIRGEFPWDDVGDWMAMERIYDKDKDGNVVVGDHKGTARDCIIIGENTQIVTSNVENIIIVDTKDCLLVCSKDKFQKVKDMVELLKKDDILSRYTIDSYNTDKLYKASIECEEIEVEGKGLIATIGVGNLNIHKDEKVIIRGELDGDIQSL